MFFKITISRFIFCFLILFLGIASYLGIPNSNVTPFHVDSGGKQHYILHPDELTTLNLDPSPPPEEESITPLSYTPENHFKQGRNNDERFKTQQKTPPPLHQEKDSSHSRIFVFLLPPASFVYQQISLVLELSRRGHDVLVASLEGFSEKLDRELGIDAFNHTRLRVMEFARVFDFVSLVDLKEATQISPDKRKKIEIKEAMAMYENMFKQVVEPLELALQTTGRSGALILHKFKQSLFVFPGPWATPIKFCVRHGFNYINVLTTPRIAKLFSTPLYVDPDTQPGIPSSISGKEMSLKSRISRLYRHAISFYRNPFPIDMQISLEHPTLKLVASLPQLTDITAHPPLTQFVGPLISASRKSAVRYPEAVARVFALGKPVIYISFGTHAALSRTQVLLLSEAFFPALDLKGGRDPSEERPYRWSLIWALPTSEQKHLLPSDLSDSLTGKKGVAIVPWIESPAVLNHPLTKMFVSHCGANGLGEAAKFGVPVLGLPLFGDQFDNCDAAKRGLKLSICRSIWSDPASLLREDAESMIFDPTNEARTGADIAKILTDKIYTGATLAADWLETAAALGGDLSFTQTQVEKSGVVIAYNLDIIASLVFTLVLLAGVGGYQWARVSQYYQNSRLLSSVSYNKKKV